MREIRIGSEDAGQRLDKYLHRYLREAGDGFIYKMLRKKRIKLNRARAEGSELLTEGDVINLYLSDDTITKFRGKAERRPVAPPLRPEEILYEDADILILDKPAGELSQQAAPGDVSINERMLSYLYETGAWSPESLYTPGICNRLDRNTSGIVLAGKNLLSLRALTELIRAHKIHKFYLAEVEGAFEQAEDWIHVEAYLTKDEITNRVTIFEEPAEGRSHIRMAYRVTGEDRAEDGTVTSHVEINLITGRTHQIRAHMSALGHPLVGDHKYGSKHPGPYMLRAYRVVFPNDSRLPKELSGRAITAPH